MIISKSNLQVVLITKNDKIPVLNNIHICSDGTTIGSNGKTIMAVSPVGRVAREALEDRIGNDALSEGITINEETAKDVLKNIPRDIQFKGLLEHCNVKPLKEDEVEFVLTDGKRPKIIKGKRWTRKYIPFEEVFKRTAESKTAVKVALNRRRLMSLLEAIDKACPDSTGNSAIYLEFSESNDVIIRSINYKNNQEVLGVMQSYKGTEGQWIEATPWYKKLCSIVDKSKILLKKVVLKKRVLLKKKPTLLKKVKK